MMFGTTNIKLNTTMFVLYQWLQVSVATTNLRPRLYKIWKGWLHVVHKMSYLKVAKILGWYQILILM